MSQSYANLIKFTKTQQENVALKVGAAFAVRVQGHLSRTCLAGPPETIPLYPYGGRGERSELQLEWMGFNQVEDLLENGAANLTVLPSEHRRECMAFSRHCLLTTEILQEHNWNGKESSP